MMKFSGIVKKHLGRGKALGFPTANIDVEEEIEEGIYVGHARIYNAPLPPLKLRGGEGELLPALIFIGAPKTFGETDKKAEIYLLDFAGGLYGKELEVELLEKLRDNQKFASAEDLVRQMRNDETQARKYFAEGGEPA